MTSVEFYYLPESPPCRTVEMVATMAGVTLNKHYINLFNKDHLEDDYVKLNPLHKVPFIIDGKLKLGESRAIATYLINKYMPADNTLYPTDPIERAKIDELLYLDMGTIDGVARKLFVPILRAQASEYDTEAQKALVESLSYLDKRLAEAKTKFALGNHLTVADLSLAASLSFIESFEFDITPYKALKSYSDNLKAEIPDYEEINKEPCENLKQYVRDLRKCATASETTKTNEPKDDCKNCRKKPEERTLVPCHHKMCSDCTAKVVNTNCPFCDTPMEYALET